MSILSINNLSYTYTGGKNTVLKDININFQENKVYSIVGKSGAGKTTFLSLISGLDMCNEGEILYYDKNLQDLDRDTYRAKEIGVIFQSYNLLTNSTALENIVLSMNISGVKDKNVKEKAYEILDKVGIDKEKASRRVLQLSGGEQQRVAIARALSHDPKIIIADEPTGNLDSETEDAIITILKKLAHEEGRCVIIVTHSMKVSSHTDEVWGMQAGNLIFIKNN